MSDRIGYDDDGDLDEIVLDATSVHIERLNDDCVWLAVERSDGDRFTFEFRWRVDSVRWIMTEGSVGSLRGGRE